MSESAKEITPVTIEHELKQSYLDYAMSVIVGRALPDVRDGLKPVHRRSLFAMHELNNDWNKPYKKSARIVGEVIGKYHPHGDSAVYDTIVRMAQPFSLRHMLIDGQGNFGSVDGDSAAAMRYTEIRLSRIAHSLMADLEKETVDFAPNYDESEFAPKVFPTRIPNILVNGSSGIAVGMATNMPPHHLGEAIDACVATIDNPQIDLEGIMAHLPGPDFPTAGIINGRAGILQAYRTGRGRIVLRAKTDIETQSNGRESIIITELPYQVNKARLQEKIGELVKDRRIEGVSAIRDESDRTGMRVVIEVRRGENAEVLLNNLFAHTQMQNVFGINMVALDHGEPKLMNLQQIIEAFISHRREVVTRRTLFELRKARERGHLLEGLGIALANIDEMIAMIKSSPTPADAKEKLLDKHWPPGLVARMLEKAGDGASRPENLPKHFGMNKEGYRLSSQQAQAILDLRLHRLTGLEQDKILKEYSELLGKIKALIEILESPDRLLEVIRKELIEVKEQFADERRTVIMESTQDLCNEDLIAEENVVVTISHLGYAKTQTTDTYQAQHRGGKGKAATKVKEEDYVQQLLVANTHDTLLCFSNLGKVYWMKTYQIPQGSRISRGRPMINLLPLQKNETISAIMAVQEFSEDRFVFMATSYGTVKRVALSQFARPRNGGIIALGLDEGDSLIGAALTDGEHDIMLFSNIGKVIRFAESNVRAMGRTARGVRGMKLAKGQKAIALIVAQDQGAILTATEAGYGKRTAIDEYRKSGRGGQGVISIQVNDRNGNVVGASLVNEEDEVILISDQGTLVRIPVSEVSVIGRNTQGVRLINLSTGEKLVGLNVVLPEDEDKAETEAEAEAKTEE